jgi:SAM-dependent methyltransferase
VQALSSLYVERRGEGNLAVRALDGAAKRAAFACFYAPLHFLTLFHALRGEPLGAAERVVDLGCGTGASGAAAALALAADGRAARVLGVDRSGFALGEARRTLAALGVRGSLRRGALPAALPPLGAGDVALSAWCANELSDAERDALLDALVRGAERGAAVVVVEPLATGAAPWWPRFVGALGPLGGSAREARVRIPLPPFLARLDRAAGLDHRELGARLLCVPPASRGPGAAVGEDREARTRRARARRPRRPRLL